MAEGDRVEGWEEGCMWRDLIFIWLYLDALEDARKAVKWATDYFIKCHVSENEFYGQVGKGEIDHDYWGRPEDMAMERPAYKIDTSNPGNIIIML